MCMCSASGCCGGLLNWRVCQQVVVPSTADGTHVRDNSSVLIQFKYHSDTPYHLRPNLHLNET